MMRFFTHTVVPIVLGITIWQVTPDGTPKLVLGIVVFASLAVHVVREHRHSKEARSRMGADHEAANPAASHRG